MLEGSRVRCCDSSLLVSKSLISVFASHISCTSSSVSHYSHLKLKLRTPTGVFPMECERLISINSHSLCLLHCYRQQLRMMEELVFWWLLLNQFITNSFVNVAKSPCTYIVNNRLTIRAVFESIDVYYIPGDLLGSHIFQKCLNSSNWRTSLSNLFSWSKTLNIFQDALCALHDWRSFSEFHVFRQ